MSGSTGMIPTVPKDVRGKQIFVGDTIYRANSDSGLTRYVVLEIKSNPSSWGANFQVRCVRDFNEKRTDLGGRWLAVYSNGIIVDVSSQRKKINEILS